MKIYIAAGIVVVSIVAIASTAILLNSQKEQPLSQPETTVSSSTQTTQEDNSPSWNEQDKKDESTTDADMASYKKFTAESFRAADGETRILFFYDTAHTPSIRLDEMLTKEVKISPTK